MVSVFVMSTGGKPPGMTIDLALRVKTFSSVYYALVMIEEPGGGDFPVLRVTILAELSQSALNGMVAVISAQA